MRIRGGRERSGQAGHRQLERELAAIHAAATAVAAERDPRAVFALVAEGAARALGAEAGLVARFDGEEATLVGAWSAPEDAAPATLGEALSLDGSGALALVHRRGRAMRAEGRSRATGGSWSQAAAPVRPGGGLWGAVQVTSAHRALPVRAEECLARLAELTALGVAGAAARSRLVAWASTDHLTGLPNRRAFDERLVEEVARAQRHERPLGLVIMDLDHFKRVNDVNGHTAGDRVLAETARRLVAEARGEELLSRVGGEEFAWLLPGSDGAGARAASERAVRAIGATPFSEVGRLTISAGSCDLAEIGGAGGADELYRLADIALYWAKAAGRDVCVAYSRDRRVMSRSRPAGEGPAPAAA